jgi:hypothetical protein
MLSVPEVEAPLDRAFSGMGLASGQVTSKLTLGALRGRKWLVALALVALTLASCSKAFDALVYNPCVQPAKVSFGLSAAVRWYSETTVPEESAVRVEDVMDASPGAVDQVRIVFGDAQTILKVRVEEEDPVPVLIPVARCPQS